MNTYSNNLRTMVSTALLELKNRVESANIDLHSVPVSGPVPTTAQAVTDSAIAAPLIQTAANGILRLASDIGSVYGILNAADFSSNIYTLGKECYTNMNSCAYDAEQLSQKAMEASAATAEISVANITSLGAEHVAPLVHHAIRSAYTFTNKIFNLDLTVSVEATGTEHTLLVTFDAYQAPFPDKAASLAHKGYPVSSYYVLLVKEDKGDIFNIADAERIILSGKHFTAIANHTAGAISKRLSITDITDTDGDKITLDKKYVAFVFAVLTTEYKRKVNNFDDFLSAPSKPFGFVNDQLTSVAANEPDVVALFVKGRSLQLHIAAPKSKQPIVTQAYDQMKQMEIAYQEIVQAYTLIRAMVTETKKLTDKLIYSAELVNKLSGLVMRQKALNPLIPDDLIVRLGTAGKDANNAVALTLTALTATINAQTSGLISGAILTATYVSSHIEYERVNVK